MRASMPSSPTAPVAPRMPTLFMRDDIIPASPGKWLKMIGAMPGELVPIRRQYLRIKQEYPDAILFFRLGDFYETFEEDAKPSSRVLDIPLTSREMGKGHRLPMAGIPAQALEHYLAKLVSQGYKIAICEQLTPPGKGLVEREVVRVVTPGTLMEPSLLPGRANNYLAAVVGEGETAGLAYADISTGEFATAQFPRERRRAEVGRPP